MEHQTTVDRRDYKGEYNALANALVGPTGLSAITEATRHRRLLDALREIARQMTSNELEREHDSDGAPDYEGAYDAIIMVARSALL